MNPVAIPINKLENNTGQIEGLPKNPRIIKDDKFKKLVKSLQDDPELFELRECLVYPHGKKYIVIAGNMRLKASQELGYSAVPCKILDAAMPVEKLRAIAIKDNIPYGEHDWEALANEWDSVELGEWGLDVWQPPTDVDYSILDDVDMDDQLKDMADGVKKAIQIEFEPEHYDQAYELVKFWRERKAYVGGMIMEHLKAEKEKL